MKNRIVLLGTLALLVTMAGCAVRFSAEVKNPWHPSLDYSHRNSTVAPTK